MVDPRVLAVDPSIASDGLMVRFMLSAPGPRPARVLVDRSTFALVGDDGDARYVGTPEPDALWASTGAPLGSLLVDLTVPAGDSGSVAFFAVPPESLPAHGSLHATLAVVMTETDDLPYPAEQVVLETPTVSPPG